ncbi:HhH-GPD family protein [Desulfovibrio sp. X2]|nr:HhH-GPD family protein [Desulfovibrio sp. X2]
MAFHRRDPQAVAERVEEHSLRKGLLWSGVPGLLFIDLLPGRAEARLDLDGPAAEKERPSFEAMVRRMLGLGQPVEEFERRFADHPQLGVLIARQRGLRVPAAATPFEALAWAVTGQQISVHAAISMRRKLIQAADIRHSSGLFCHPDAACVAGLGSETLRKAGYSVAKARTLLELARMTAGGELPLDAWEDSWLHGRLDAQTAEGIRERLLDVRGIGPWTVNYVLLRGFGWLDGDLSGDVAVRRGLGRLLGSEEKVDAAYTREWLAQFSPWRALVAAHLWASLSAASY